MGLGSIVGGIVNAGVKALGGSSGIGKVVGAVAQGVAGSQESGGVDDETKKKVDKMIMERFVDTFTKASEDAQKQMEEAVKKGDPGAV
jgi:hypothetical protein